MLMEMVAWCLSRCQEKVALFEIDEFMSIEI